MQARAVALEAERQRLQREVEADAKVWAAKKNAYWKEGFDSKVHVPNIYIIYMYIFILRVCVCVCVCVCVYACRHV